MSNDPIRIAVDLTNPGQFFACCGLLELADRLWQTAEGWFEEDEFCLRANGTLAELISAFMAVSLVQLDKDNDTSSRIAIGDPFRPIELNWWQDDRAGGKELKVWAGTMESVRIAQSMQLTLKDERFSTPDLFNIGVIAYDPENSAKKVEPYYFDARRCPNAHSRDVGFSANDLQLTTTAFPAVEVFCLIGLQRCLPAANTNNRRVFDYFAWSEPASTELVPALVAGHIASSGRRGYRFENWYRTGQRKHKAFRSATLLSER